jgi:endonuclease/exonuclease/phosphatase family metal-dependent hydrolase
VPKRLGDDDGFEIQTIAHDLNLNLVYAPAMRNGPGQEDRGNAILSTLPLDDVTVIELPIERQRRVGIAATAHALGRDGTPWTMRLVSVHLETRAGALRRGPASARRRQAEFLVQALGESSAPIVVAGDFNTSWGDDEPAVKTLRRSYPDAPPVGGTTWGKAFISAKLDHVFARVPAATIDVRRGRDRYRSDHFPLVAVLKP